MGTISKTKRVERDEDGRKLVACEHCKGTEWNRTIHEVRKDRVRVGEDEHGVHDDFLGQEEVISCEYEYACAGCGKKNAKLSSEN